MLKVNVLKIISDYQLGQYNTPCRREIICAGGNKKLKNRYNQDR